MDAPEPVCDRSFERSREPASANPSMNLAAFMRHAALAEPDREAICVGDTCWATYGRLGARAASVAAALRARGCAPGARIAIAMTNCPQFFEVLFGAWHAGLVAVPINAKLHPNELAWILDHCGARLCFVTPDLAEDVAGLTGDLDTLDAVVSVDDPAYEAMAAGPGMDMAHAEPADPAWLFYTSGTTGRPKGAILTHRVLMAMTMAYFADIDHVAPGDTLVHAAPLSHGSGLYSLSHIAKAACNVIPESGHFAPDEIASIVNAREGVSFFAAPTMLTRLMNAPGAGDMNPAHLKTITYGGGPMYVADLRRALETWGPRLYQLFAQGEAPMTVTGLSQRHHAMADHPRYEDWLASVGFPRTGVEVRVVDGNDEDLPPGEPGEILARGDVVMAGYWRDPEATAETLRGGWLHMGDAGALDATGFVTLKDRIRDMIVSGGSNVYPREIEEVLLRHEAVLEASVVGRPHPEWGEEVVAFVVERKGRSVDDAALDRLCLGHVARFKRPRCYVRIDSLPKNNYGKVLKTALRDRLAALPRPG